MEESELTITIRDGYPVSPGHSLIVLRRHVSSFFEATIAEQSAILDGLHLAKAGLVDEYEPSGWNIGINVDEDAGQTIMHVHVHLIPRYEGDVVNPRGGIRHVIPGLGDYSLEERK